MSSTVHSAPGANAGFAYQFERALYWLAQSPAGAAIGIETDDDVAVRSADGSQLLEQDKYSTQDGSHPFGDRSKGLWNTVGIWIDAIETGQVAWETARFLMVTNTVLPECIAKRLARSEVESDVDGCINALKKAGENPPKHIELLVGRVLRAESSSTLRRLIPKVDVADATQGTAGPQLRQKTISHLQLPKWCLAGYDSIADELLGWLHNTTQALWQQRQPGWIQRDNFVEQLHAVLSRRERQMKRERAENVIPVSADSVGNEKGRPFVKQVHLVTEDDSVVDTAIRDFIRCNIEKVRLSIEGNVTDEDWKAFSATLQSRWQRIRARVLRMDKDQPEEDIGFKVFSDTVPPQLEMEEAFCR